MAPSGRTEPPSKEGSRSRAMVAPSHIVIEMQQGVTQRLVRSNNASSSDGTDSQRQNNNESGRPAETTTTNNAAHHLNLDDTLPVFFSKGIPLVDLFLVVSSFFKMLQQHHSWSWTAIIYLMSFFLSSCVHVVGISSSRCIQSKNRRGMIAYLSTVLRMLGAAALLLFVDNSVHSVALLPLLLVLALVAALSWRTFRSGEEVGLNWGHFKEELDLQFDLSAKVVYMAFAGLSGTVLGYLNVSSHQTRGRGFMAVVPKFFLFYGVVFGLLQVLLCTVPARIMLYDERRRMAKVYKPVLAYVALLFVVLASIVAAEDILRVNVFFVFFVIIVAVVISFLWRNQRVTTNAVDEQLQPATSGSTTAPADSSRTSANARREQDANLSWYLLSGYFLPLFSLIMLTHSMYSMEGHTASVSWQIKALLFCGLCSILSYAVRIVVYAGMRDGDRYIYIWATSCTCATYGTMTITVISLLLVLTMKSDELKKILVS